jgi:hypothetical protein
VDRRMLGVVGWRGGMRGGRRGVGSRRLLLGVRVGVLMLRCCRWGGRPKDLGWAWPYGKEGFHFHFAVFQETTEKCSMKQRESMRMSTMSSGLIKLFIDPKDY